MLADRRDIIRRACIGLLALSGVAAAHGPITTKLTWTREISRVFYKRCVSCHREGGAAPMSLTTYEQARPWAKAIQEEVLERRMPPWGAVKGFGDFEDEAGLTQDEIHLLSDWVDGGAPEGDSRFLPELPRFEAQASRGVGTRQAESLRHGGLTISRALRVTAIAPRDLPKGASVRVIARRPDSSIEPMLWIYDFNPKFARTYVYRTPVDLPAGTRMEVIPASSGGFVLSEQPARAAK